jgi:hypothetical protein
MASDTSRIEDAGDFSIPGNRGCDDVVGLGGRGEKDDRNYSEDCKSENGGFSFTPDFCGPISDLQFATSKGISYGCALSFRFRAIALTLSRALALRATS